MRGALRFQVLSLLALSGAITGALVGWVAGLLWLATGFPEATTTAAVVAVLASGTLELLGRPAPPAIRQQVPQYWGRIFGPRTVAVLYGARLGVGPATILPTWLWWGSFLLAATCGPWVGAAAGAVFALARTAVTHAAVAGVRHGGRMSSRIAAVRRLERPVAVGIALLLAVAALAGCGGGGGDDEDAAPRRRPPRTSTTTSTTEAPLPTSSVPATPEVLAMDNLLLDDALPGFRRDDAAVGAGPLDLEAAARAEPDADAERALLETRGFVRGASRAWVGPDDDVVYLAVYEFVNPAEAALYLEDGTEHLTARDAERFEVPGVDGARGFTTVDRREGGSFTAHAVSFTRGPRWFLVLLGSPTGARTQAEAADLASRQAGLV